MRKKIRKHSKPILSVLLLIVIIAGSVLVPSETRAVSEKAVITSSDKNASNTNPQYGIYFNADRENGWAVSWQKNLEAVEDGLYVDGTQDNDSLKLRKVGATEYYIVLDGKLGDPIADSTRVTIRGTFSDGSTKLGFEGVTFEYRTTGGWTLLKEKDAYTILDYEMNTSRDPGGFYFKTDGTDSLAYSEKFDKRYWAKKGGVYLNDVLMKDVSLIKVGADLYYVALGDAQKATSGDIVRIEGTYGEGKTTVKFRAAEFEYQKKFGGWVIGGFTNNGKIDVSATLTLLDHANNEKRDGSGFYFTVDQDDPLPYSEKQDKRYASLQGGVYLNDELLSDVSVIKTAPRTYYVALGEVKKAKTGNVVRIDGIFGFGKKTVKFQSASFEYQVVGGVGTWKLGGFKPDGTEAKTKNIDLFDVTEVTSYNLAVDKALTLGDMGANQNVCLRMNVKLTYSDSASAKQYLDLGILKTEEKGVWHESGYNVWLIPSSGEVVLWDYATEGRQVMKAEEVEGLDKECLLEFGAANITDKGKVVARKVYVNINGTTVLTYYDKNTTKENGTLSSVYAPSFKGEFTAEFTTLYKTAKLPVKFIVNGEEKKTCDLVAVSNQVVTGKDSVVQIQIPTYENIQVVLDKLTVGGKEVKELQEEDTQKKDTGIHKFRLSKPAANAQMVVELTTHELKTDTAKVLDFYDVAGVPSYTVQSKSNAPIGDVSTDGKVLGTNIAIQFMIDIPEDFNCIWVVMLGSGTHIWSYCGSMLMMYPGELNLCYPQTQEIFATSKDQLYTGGNSIAVEMGVVKCYMDGIYKYDRKYIKVGTTPENMKTVTYYDDIERGNYSTAVLARGTDKENVNYTLRSMKTFHTLTDASDVTETQKLSGITMKEHRTEKQAVYYPQYVADGEKGQISLYTKEAMKLGSLRVGNTEQAVTVTEDGGYVCEIPSVKSDMSFSYTVVDDSSRYTVTAEETTGAKVEISEADVAAAGATNILVKTEKGYVPEKILVNDKDYTKQFVYDEAQNGWTLNLTGIRENKVVKVTVSKKDYTVTVKEAKHAELTYAGDVKDGKIPAGGKLTFNITPKNGWYVKTAKVNGEEMPVSGNKVEAKNYYAEGDSAEIEVVLMKGKTKAATSDKQTVIMLTVIGTIVVLGGIATVLVVTKKKKESAKDGNKEKETTL